MATISTHHGTTAHRAHNIRVNSVIESQEHIDKDRTRDNLILIDETPQHAYQRIFGESVKNYNAKQSRDDRKIKNYYSKIKNSSQRVPVYESLIGVYPDKNETLTQSENVQILSEFLEKFKAANPNFEVVGAYIHLDEKSPHMHLDYIPVGHGYTRGMDTQVSMDKALKEQGYYTRGSKDTALKHWTKDINVLLESTCNEHGLNVEHPEAGNGTKHLETEAYKLSQDIAEQKEELECVKDETAAVKKDLEKLTRATDDWNSELQTIKEDFATFEFKNQLEEQRADYLQKQVNELVAAKDDLSTSIDRAQNVLNELELQQQRALQIDPDNIRGNKRKVIEDMQHIIAEQRAQLEAYNYRSGTEISGLLQLPNELKTVQKQNADLTRELSEKNRRINSLENSVYALQNEQKNLNDQLDVFIPRIVELAGKYAETRPQPMAHKENMAAITMAAMTYTGTYRDVWNKDFLQRAVNRYEKDHPPKEDLDRQRSARYYDDLER